MFSGPDLISRFSVAGVWDPIGTHEGGLGNTVFANIALGPDGRQGLIATGWVLHPGSSNFLPVDIAILSQRTDGTLVVDTSSFVSSATTSGGNSAVVHDLNGDGQDD